MIDIHAHVLPGLDDGPNNMKETDALLRAFKTSGVDTVICTSHYLSPHFDVTQDMIDQAFALVQENHPGDAWPVLIKGAEVRVSRKLIPDIRAKQVPTLGDSMYVLIEFPTPDVSQENLELVHELLIRGYKPIMAHPERNIGIQRHPELIDDLIDAGVRMQVTASYVASGPHGRHPGHQIAWEMLKAGKVHFIASDAHDTAHRPPDLVPSMESLLPHIGQDKADALTRGLNEA